MPALRVATAPAPYNLLSGSTFYTSLISQFFLPPPLPLFWLSFHLVFLLAAFTTGCSAVILPQGGRSHSGHLAPSGFPSQASPPRAGRQRPVFFVQLSASLGGGKKGRGQPVSVEHLVSRHRLAGPAGSAVTVRALGWRSALCLQGGTAESGSFLQAQLLLCVHAGQRLPLLPPNPGGHTSSCPHPHGPILGEKHPPQEEATWRGCA